MMTLKAWIFLAVGAVCLFLSAIVSDRLGLPMWCDCILGALSYLAAAAAAVSDQ